MKVLALPSHSTMYNTTKFADREESLASRRPRNHNLVIRANTTLVIYNFERNDASRCFFSSLHGAVHADITPRLGLLCTGPSSATPLSLLLTRPIVGRNGRSRLRFRLCR